MSAGTQRGPVYYWARMALVSIQVTLEGLLGGRRAGEYRKIPGMEIRRRAR